MKNQREALKGDPNIKDWLLMGTPILGIFAGFLIFNEFGDFYGDPLPWYGVLFLSIISFIANPLYYATLMIVYRKVPHVWYLQFPIAFSFPAIALPCVIYVLGQLNI